MKKLLIILGVLFLTAGIVVSANLKPYPFLFNGRWQPTEEPLLIDEGGFQDVQNVRKYGKRFKGVKGSTKINTTALATYEFVRNGYHFRKEQPSESHVLVFGADAATQTAATIWENTTAIPSAGNYSATAVYTDSANTGLGRFSTWPQGNLGYADGEQSLVWGGDEYPISQFILTTDHSFSNPKDKTDKVKKSENSVSSSAVLLSRGLDCKLLLHLDGANDSTTITDETGTHSPTIESGGDLDTTYSKFGNASALLSGADNWVQVLDHADFNFSKHFSIDFWVRFDGIAADKTFWMQRTDADNYFWVYWDQSEETVDIQVNAAASLVVDLSYAWSPVVDTWYHVVITNYWGETEDTWAIAIDGTSIGSTLDANNPADYTGNVYIGDGRGTDGTVGVPIDGRLDEVRVISDTAAAPDWTYTANFTPFEEPYPSGATGYAYWYVGTTRPINGLKYYMQTTNLLGSTTIGSRQTWNGSDWVTLSGWSDGTNGLSQNGSTTWTDATTIPKVTMINGLSLYWYKFALTKGVGAIYYVTADADMQNVQNIWDGEETAPFSVKLYEDSTYKDYTDEVSEIDTYTMPMDSLVAGTEYLLVGFTESMSGIRVLFSPGKENTDATVLTVWYWSGVEWIRVSSLSDGTDEPAGDSFGKTGYITWLPITGAQEAPRTISDELPLYYYKLSWSVALDVEVEVDYISGIPATEGIGAYKFPGSFQERAWLFSETNGDKNKAIYSAYNTPDVWNGSDSGAIYFGNNTELIAAAQIYNVFQTTGYYQLLVTKKNETYRVFGSSPATWEVQQMSGTIGTIAPLSMAVCDISEITTDTRRHVAIWQSQSGVVMCDGATIIPISQDIACYWDSGDTRYIPTDRQDDSVGWYDPNLRVYKLLISSGSGQTTHNVELEYSLEHNEWTKIHREDSSGADPLQTAFTVQDTDGVAYTYGTTDDGYLLRLENGKTWHDASAIDQYLHTKAMLLDSDQPYFFRTLIRYFRLTFDSKATGIEWDDDLEWDDGIEWDIEDLVINHYCDNTLSVDGTGGQSVVSNIDINQTDEYETQSVILGHCLSHSFKFEMNASTVTDGMELTGMGLLYDTEKTIRE